VANWKDNKGSGPWDFVERGNKFGYLNNPDWTDQEESVDFSENLGYSINSTTHHSPCGHWHKARWYDIVGGRWVAAMQQPGTPYIYVYNITDKQVIRIDTSTDPVMVDGILRLQPTYDLDYDMGYGNPGAQRGGYCMDKSGRRIWYLFTDPDGDRTDVELIEVDITSYYMRKVKSTIFPNIMDPGILPSYRERINDGCTNGIYTYWPTTLIAGRIIVIRNSDHTIVDDHYFNYPIEACGGGINDEAIPSIDYGSGRLYWTYCRDYIFCVPPWNVCRHLIGAAINLVADIEDISCGTGLHTPANQNMLRIYNNKILQHRAYHPSFDGRFMNRNLDLTLNAHIGQEYLQNILGVIGSSVYTLMHVNSAAHPAFIYCIDLSTMTETSKLDISYYTGQAYMSSYDWDWSSVSALNNQTGKILIFRYHNIEKRNHAAVFDASSDLTFNHDERFHRYYDDPTRGPFGEPQVWSIKE